eukprot:s4821_g1.t1
MSGDGANADDVELHYLTAVLEELVRSQGCAEIRADPSRNLMGTATADPTEESVASLADTVSMVLAHFGTQIPLGSKIRAALFQVNANLGLWPAEALVKDVTSWAEVQGSILRVHCTYMVRLWRKTKHSSKNEVIQQLKDVLNAIACDPEASSAAAPAPADSHGEAADGASTAASAGDSTAASAGGSTAASAAGSTDTLEGSGSSMDVMETLPYPVVEDVGQQDPQNPGNPAPAPTPSPVEALSEEASAAPVASSSANALDSPDVPSVGMLDREWTEEEWQEWTWSWYKPFPRHVPAESAEEPLPREVEVAPDVPAESLPEVELIPDVPSDTLPEEPTAVPPTHEHPPDHAAEDLPADEEAPDSHSAVEAERSAKDDIAQLNKRTVAEHAPPRRARVKKAALAPAPHEDGAPEEGAPVKGRGRGRGRGKGTGRGGRKGKGKGHHGENSPGKDDESGPEPSASSQPSKPKNPRAKRGPKSKKNEQPDDKPMAKKSPKATEPSTYAVGDEVKAVIKPMLPELTSYKVVPYWSRGQATVETKATKYMKKRELAFIDLSSIKGASFEDIVKPCIKLANALEKGEILTTAMQRFYDERNYLASLYEVSPGEPKPKRSRRAA